MRELVLEDALEVLIDHRGKTPKKLGADFVAQGVPVASAILVNDGVLNLDDARHVSDDVYRRWMPIPTQEGDVLLTSEAPLGRVARVPSNAPLVLGQRLFGLRGKAGVLHTGYLYYALQTARVQSDLVGRSTGTTVIGIRQSALRSLRIPAPLYEEQGAIAEVLGALDDKIAANSRRWKSGLDLLLAKYRWVAARADRWFPLGEAYSVGLSGVWGTDEPSAEYSMATTCLRGRDLEQYISGDIPDAPKRYISHRQASKREWEYGEIWTAGSGTLGPSILMTPEIAASWEEPVTYSNFVKRLVPKDGFVQYSLAWLAMVNTARRQLFESFATGTAIPNLDAKALLDGLLIPSASAHEASELADQTRSLTNPAILRENAALATTRDALIPALMAGKLRVRDAHRAIEEVS